MIGCTSELEHNYYSSSCFDPQEKAGKRAADDDIFFAFKKKKDEGEVKSAMIPREEVYIFL